jgi:hypothetical protein
MVLRISSKRGPFLLRTDTPAEGHPNISIRAARRSSLPRVTTRPTAQPARQPKPRHRLNHHRSATHARMTQPTTTTTTTTAGHVARFSLPHISVSGWTPGLVSPWGVVLLASGFFSSFHWRTLDDNCWARRPRGRPGPSGFAPSLLVRPPGSTAVSRPFGLGPSRRHCQVSLAESNDAAPSPLRPSRARPPAAPLGFAGARGTASPEGKGRARPNRRKSNGNSTRNEMKLK